MQLNFNLTLVCTIATCAFTLIFCEKLVSYSMLSCFTHKHIAKSNTAAALEIVYEQI